MTYDNDVIFNVLDFGPLKRLRFKTSIRLLSHARLGDLVS